MYKKFLSSIIITTFFIGIFGFALDAAAIKVISSDNFTKFSGATGYNVSANDPVVIAGKIINVVLGLMGVVFAIFLIYGGIQWMTSGGESARVDRGKNIIKNSIIGIIITLSAYAISTFVVNAILTSVTQ